MKEDKKKKFIESADDLARLIDERTDELLCILSGKKNREVKKLLVDYTVEMNPTKRKLVELVENKMNSKINEQTFSI